jgi:hypothetical protein
MEPPAFSVTDDIEVVAQRRSKSTLQSLKRPYSALFGVDSSSSEEEDQQLPKLNIMSHTTKKIVNLEPQTPKQKNREGKITKNLATLSKLIEKYK